MDGASCSCVTSPHATLSGKQAIWKDFERGLELFVTDSHVTSHFKNHRPVIVEIRGESAGKPDVLRCFMHFSATAYMM